jgi:hypothetical protein
MTALALILMILCWAGMAFGGVVYVFFCIWAVMYVLLQSLAFIGLAGATLVGNTDMFKKVSIFDLLRMPISSGIYIWLGIYGITNGFMWAPILLLIGAGFGLINGLFMAIGAQRCIDES